MTESKFVLVGPGVKPNPDAVLDVVFVHGLTGDANDTWRCEGGYWPEWLGWDFSQINVYSVGYSSAVWKDFLKGNEASLRDRASTVAQYLATRKSRAAPILFITHSLGGLIVKKLLRLCHGATDPKLKAVAAKARAISFIATPHSGSNLATALNAVLSIATTETTKELKKNSEDLIDLAGWFSGWAYEEKIIIQAFYETQKHKSLLIVDKVSANPNVVGCNPIAIDCDHVAISKLNSKEDLIYLSVAQLIEDLITDVESGNGGDGSDGDLEAEFKLLCEQAPKDRRTLAEKLAAASRDHEIENAEARKEQFNMALRRNITSPAAVGRYTRLMGNVKSRFDRHVSRAKAAAAPINVVDGVIQTDVIDGTVQAQANLGEPTTAMQVEGALYYLAGNCHLRWD